MRKKKRIANDSRSRKRHNAQGKTPAEICKQENKITKMDTENPNEN